MHPKSKGVFLFTLFLGGFLASNAFPGALTFGLKLSGGVNSLVVGDFNRDIEGTNTFLRDLAAANGMPLPEGEFKKIQYGFEFEGDILILLTPKFGLGIGSGYLRGETGKNKNRAVVYYPGYNRTNEMNLRISTVPVRLSAYYFVPVFSNGRLFVNAGAGYYFGQYRKQYWSEWKGPGYDDWLTYDETAKGETLGFHGGLGLEVAFSRKMSLVVEGHSRYAKVKELSGHNDWTASWLEGTVRTEGKLYYYESYNSATGTWHSSVELEDSISPSPSLRNQRLADCDFSGFSVRVGLKWTL